MTPTRLTVDRLGHEGDGLSVLPDGRKVIIPLALPQEEVEGKLMGETLVYDSLLTASPQRAEPFCAWFGECGGCQLQHMGTEIYGAFKKERLLMPLKQQKVDLPSEEVPLHTLFEGKRRRTTLSLYKQKGVFVAGYKARQSLKIIPITHCPLLEEAVEAVRLKLCPVLEKVIPAQVQVKVMLTRVQEGVDVQVSGAKALTSAQETLLISQTPPEVTRLMWGKQLLLQRHLPTVSFGGLSLPFPAGGFLQPSQQGEDTLRERLLQCLPTPKALKSGGGIAELFCGMGTFTLPLAQKGYKVTAFDSTQEGIEALQKAVMASALPIKAAVRDLYKDPLSVLELNKFSAVVLDPPRTGAQEQSALLAQSRVPVVVMISCHPATFARDSALLQKGGYRLRHLEAIDQFPWTSHVESISVFEKG